MKTALRQFVWAVAMSLGTALASAPVLAEVVIDFGTTDLGVLPQYEEDGFRLTAIDNGVLTTTNHFDIHIPGLIDGSLSLHGGDGSSVNAEEVLLTSISGSTFDLLGFGTFTDNANLWEMVSSSGGQYTFPTGLTTHTQVDFGPLFQNVTSVTFQSNAIPLTSLSDSFTLDEIHINVGQVPEPTTLALATFGLLSLGMIGRRRRRVS